MEITSTAVRYGKNAIPQRFAAAATAWIVLGSSSGNVCAQNSMNHSPMITPLFESGFMPRLSGFETLAVRTNPPAISVEQLIEKPGESGGASIENIIQVPATAQAGSASVRFDQPASFMEQDDDALAKVSVTDEWTPVLTQTPNSVTLWDEIAPPLPSPVPNDNTAVHSTPGEVANTEAHTTQ